MMHSVSRLSGKSIPYVSHSLAGHAYPRRMPNKKTQKTVNSWGSRFREALKAQKSNLRKVAENMDVAESTVRSWTNGHRDINLNDFLRLCDAAALDPAVILFADQVDSKFMAVGEAWNQATKEERESLALMAEAIIARRGSQRQSGAT